jgi:hypothetical protein
MEIGRQQVLLEGNVRMSKTRASNGVAAIVLSAALSACMLPSRAIAGEDGPGSFACRFDTGTSWSYEGGKFASSPSAVLAFDVTDIDLEGQSAKLMNDGKVIGSLRIVRALNANHFLEVANEGFLNLTTIYDQDPTTGSHPAVHSRHFGLLGQPVFAQYAGVCAAK